MRALLLCAGQPGCAPFNSDYPLGKTIMAVSGVSHRPHVEHIPHIHCTHLFLHSLPFKCSATEILSVCFVSDSPHGSLNDVLVIVWRNTFVL